MLRIGIVAGEPSGDKLAAGLIEALRARVPDVQVSGVAGPNMVAAGCEPWAAMERLSVMGIPEIVRRYRELKAFQRQVIDHFRARRPDVFIGVDAPEFNLGVEKDLRSAGIRTVHYVSPSVWAWREGRLKTIARAVDRMLVLFPFEETYYRERQLPATFVSHPLADELAVIPGRARARAELGIGAEEPVLALLPGSRMNEMGHLARPFVETAAWCRERIPGLRILVPFASGRTADLFASLHRRHAPALVVATHLGAARKVLAAADATLVASGTATLEAMFLGCPMVVAYKASWLSYGLIRPLLRISRFALPNILAGEEVVPEFIQGRVHPIAMGRRLLELLRGGAVRDRMLARFAELRGQFPAGASDRAAAAVLHLVQPRSAQCESSNR